MKTKKTYTSKDLENLLSNRFCQPAWAFLPQVRNGTGYARATRTADALAMSLYPSRGLDLYGFEIKINRGDWLSELKNPDKAEALAKYCDFWYIVAPKGVAKLEELPSTWGLMIPFGSTVKIIKEAKQLKPKPLDHLFLGGILRKAQEIITPSSELYKVRMEGYKNGAENAKRDFKWKEDEHIRLKEKVKNFEKISGVDIDTWSSGDIGEAVKMVLNSEHLRIKKRLKNLLSDAKEIVEDIEKNIK